MERRTLDVRIGAAFGLYDALLRTLDDETLARRLGDLPSNQIGQQLWCVVGARESYTRAIERGGWSGFSCSLGARDTTDRKRVAVALRASAAAALDVLARLDELTEVQEGLALTLLEHEAQHHGQLIRYLYGLRLPIPDVWGRATTLSELDARKQAAGPRHLRSPAQDPSGLLTGLA